MVGHAVSHYICPLCQYECHETESHPCSALGAVVPAHADEVTARLIAEEGGDLWRHEND